MSLQFKPALIIIGTLIIGMILGAFISSMFIHRRFEHIRSTLGPRVFPERIMRAIGPMDEDQREAVMTVVEQTSEKMRAVMDGSRGKMRAVMDSMLVELSPMLSDEQMERLKDRIGRMHERGMRGPPGKPRHWSRD